jgi:hypothetical protein
MLREVLNQYINLVKKLTDQTINDELKMEIINLIKNNFTEAYQIKNNYDNAKIKVVEDFWKKLNEKLNEKLEEKWRVEKRDDNSLGINYSYLLINKENNSDASFYIRYSKNAGDLVIGIILNLENSKNEGHDILKKLPNNGNSKSGKLSVLWESFNTKKIYDIEFLNEIAENSDNKIIEFIEKINDYIDSNEKYYKNVLKHLETK